MKSPPKKKLKTDLTDIEKAFIVKTLISLRESKEMVHLFRPTLQEFSRVCGYSELTILKWAKPSVREPIYKKAQEMMDAGGVLKDRMFSDMSLDTQINQKAEIDLASVKLLQEKMFSEMSIDTKIWNDNVVKMPLLTQSQTGSSIGTDDDENEKDKCNKYR